MVDTLPTHSFAPSNRVLWLLRWMVVVQCTGYAALLATPSSLNAWLLNAMGHSFVTGLDAWGSVLLWASVLALPLLGFVRPAGTVGRPWVMRCDLALLCFVVTWALTEAFFSWRANIGNPFRGTDPYGHAVRYVAPFALLLLWGTRGGNVRTEWILRLSAVATFVGHGLCAWWMNPEFLDLILGTMDAFLGEDWESAEHRQVLAEAALPWIAFQDFVLAGLLLLPKRLRWVALWMAIWGLVTAMSRMTAFGWERWPDLCLRVCNGGIPLLLWIHWQNLLKNRPSQ